jgi:hypothetical protein
MHDTLNSRNAEPLRALKRVGVLALVGALCLSPAQAHAKDTNPHLMLSKMTTPQDYKCLDAIITAESAWNPRSSSPTYDYGLPQRHMPGYTRKQIEAWLTDTHKQLTWMIAYCKTRYGSPCQALEARKIKGWY